MKFPRAISRRAARPVAARLLTAGLLTMTLAGCGGGGWFGDSEPPPLPGERISVLRLERQLEPDPRLARPAGRTAGSGGERVMAAGGGQSGSRDGASGPVRPAA